MNQRNPLLKLYIIIEEKPFTSSTKQTIVEISTNQNNMQIYKIEKKKKEKKVEISFMSNNGIIKDCVATMQ